MITQSELIELLKYNPRTGCFTWKKKTCLKVVIGKLAGTINSKGYIVITISRKLYRAHRLAWFYIHGVWPKDQIDHVNHVRTDNRIINLREASNLENHKNMSMAKNNTSGITGVNWNKTDRSWRASITLNLKSIHLGQRKDKFEAICLRKSAENKLGFHLNHGK